MGRLTRRFRGVVRREAHDLLHGGPPTLDLLRPIGPAVPSDAQVQQVLDVCMGVGEVLLASGEPAVETTETMLRMAAALGLPTVDIDITFNSITMCCHRGMVAAPLTTMRIVRYRTTDLTRMAAVSRIVAQVERHGLSVHRAAEELADAVAANHPYPRWAATLGWAGQAAAVAVLLGGGLIIAASAFAVTALIDRLGRLLGRFGVAPFFLQMVGAIVATVVDARVVRHRRATRGHPVVAGDRGGHHGAALRAVGGRHRAGRDLRLLRHRRGPGGRGGAAVRGPAHRCDPRVEAGRRVQAHPGPGRTGGGRLRPVLALRVRGGDGGGHVRAGLRTPRIRSLLAAGLAGGIGWAVYGALTLFAHLGPVVSTGVAATFVGIATGVARRGSGVHSHVIVLAGIIPLLPGLTAYRGFYQLAVQGVVDGLVTVLLALAIGLALAAGVALGNFVARPRVTHAVVQPD